MDDSSSDPFVRPYNPSTDHDAVIHVFRETADSSLNTEPLMTLGSYLWCRPYVVLAPSTCFVLDDGHGRAVGYILGTPDTPSFCARWPTEYVPEIRKNLHDLPLPDHTLEGTDREALAARCDSFLHLIHAEPHAAVYGQHATHLGPWPGHLHINILPSHQRRGFGRQMIDTFLRAVRAEGCEGIYLGMVGTNKAAGAFYEGCGFRRLPHILDDGTSGEMGRTKGDKGGGGATVYYVREV